MEEVNGEHHEHEGDAEVDVADVAETTEQQQQQQQQQQQHMVEGVEDVQCMEDKQEAQQDDEVDEDEQQLSDSKKVQIDPSPSPGFSDFQRKIDVLFWAPGFNYYIFLDLRNSLGCIEIKPFYSQFGCVAHACVMFYLDEYNALLWEEKKLAIENEVWICGYQFISEDLMNCCIKNEVELSKLVMHEF